VGSAVLVAGAVAAVIYVLGTHQSSEPAVSTAPVAQQAPAKAEPSVAPIEDPAPAAVAPAVVAPAPAPAPEPTVAATQPTPEPVAPVAPAPAPVKAPVITKTSPSQHTKSFGKSAMSKPSSVQTQAVVADPMPVVNVPARKSETKPEAKTETKSEPKAKDSKKDADPSLDDLLKEAGDDGQTKKGPAKPVLENKALSAEDFKHGMSAVAAKAQACYKGTQGVAQLKLTVAPSGQVSKVTVNGAFAGKPEADCLTKAVKGATFPPWDGGPQTIGYSYLLSE
jgi:hypothetical protein